MARKGKSAARGSVSEDAERLRSFANKIVEEQCDGTEDFSTRSLMFQSVLEQGFKLFLKNEERARAKNRQDSED